MNFIIDENVSLAVVKMLRQKGHNVISICEEPYSSIKDLKIFDLVIKKKSILITRDEHFSNPIRFPAKRTKGIVLIRPGNIKSEDESDLVKQFIERHKIDTLSACLITLYRDRITILPSGK